MRKNLMNRNSQRHTLFLNLVHRQCSFIWVAACCFSVILLTGCQRKAVVKQRRITVAPTASKVSPFDMAMEFLNNLDQYQPDQVRIQILDNLREWANEEEAAVNWIADPMFRRLPKDLKEKYTADGLATKSFLR